MAEKQLEPPETSKSGTSTTGGNTSNQIMMRARRTTKIHRRGNESESDSEYVSTVETTRTTNTMTTGTEIATTESQLPPPIQELLTWGTTSSGTGSRYGELTSVISARRYEPEPGTTVTHTTITYCEPESTSSSVPMGSTSNMQKPQSEQPYDTTPRKAPKMVVPNISAPVQSPLLLRVNPLQSSAIAHLSGTRLSTPKHEVIVWKAESRETARYRLVPSVEMPIYCTFAMPPYVANIAAIQHIINTPVQTVIAFCLPPKQKVKKRRICRKLACAHLMLPPQGPLEAEKLRPLWETVTFTIAYGKHMVIAYRIPKLQSLKVQIVKCNKYRAIEKDSKVLYKKIPEQKVINWTAAKPHQIILTTVEKSDPQMVKRVRLEQNPLFERMPAQCNVAEVDSYITEQVEYKTPSTTGEQTRTEKHLYHEHQLIQRWENTVHVENRRRRIDE